MITYKVREGLSGIMEYRIHRIMAEELVSKCAEAGIECPSVDDLMSKYRYAIDDALCCLEWGEAFQFSNEQ